MNTCHRGSLLDTRDRAVLLVLLDTGMRLAEFLALNKGDLDPIKGTILIRSGKVGKYGLQYLGEKSRHVLRLYLKGRKDYNPALWVSSPVKTNRNRSADDAAGGAL